MGQRSAVRLVKLQWHNLKHYCTSSTSQSGGEQTIITEWQCRLYLEMGHRCSLVNTFHSSSEKSRKNVQHTRECVTNKHGKRNRYILNQGRKVLKKKNPTEILGFYTHWQKKKKHVPKKFLFSEWLLHYLSHLLTSIIRIFCFCFFFLFKFSFSQV